MWWKQRLKRRDDDSETAVRADQAIGAVRDARVIEPLIVALQEGTHVEARRAAAEALGLSGDPRSVEPLVLALEDADLWVRHAAGQALQSLRWQPNEPRERALTAIAARRFDDALQEGEAAVEPLIASLNNAHQDARKTEVVGVLARTGDARVLAALGIALTDSDAAVRVAAAQAFAAIGDHRGVEPLIAAFSDTDAKVRSAAVEALVKIGSAATDLLIRHLAHESPTVRAAAAGALGQIRDSRTQEPLVWLLGDSAPEVRGAAATGLQTAADPSAVEPLIEALKDEHWSVRKAAAETLGVIGDERSLPALVTALDDMDSWVRHRAADALSRIGDEQAVESLIKTLDEAGAHHYGVPDAISSATRIAAAQGLGRIGDPRALPSLLRARRDRDAALRDAATAALRQIGAAALYPLLEVLQEQDLAERRWAADLLGQIGDVRAVEPLIDLLQNDPKAGVRATAAEALARIGDPRAIEPLLRARRDDADIRRTVDAALKAMLPTDGPDMDVAATDPMSDIK